MRDLFVTSQFRKDFSKTPQNVQNKLDKIVNLLRQNLIADKNLNIKKLKGVKGNFWRVRIESYRIIFSFNKTSLILHRLCHRKDIYRNI